MSDLGAAPIRADVREKILTLISGDQSRQSVADWAAQWVRLSEPDVEDRVVWKAIKRLAGADLRTSPTTYLHRDEDFVTWLRDLGDS